MRARKLVGRLERRGRAGAVQGQYRWLRALAGCAQDRAQLVAVLIEESSRSRLTVRERSGDARARQALALRGIEAMLLVDEPGLAHAGLEARRADDVHVWDPLRNTGATTSGRRVTRGQHHTR